MEPSCTFGDAGQETTLGINTQRAEGIDPDNCRKFSSSDKELEPYIAAVEIGNADQVAIEKDYWTAYHNSRSVGAEVLEALFFGLLGFPAGLALWIFYRLVYFAVKG